MVDFHHLPVLPHASIDALNIRPDSIYVDGTLGGGGHSALIMAQLGNGKLYGIDRDPQALAAATARVPGLIPIHGNFHDMDKLLHEQGIHKVDGVLLDLGVSSFQLDTPERGFSYRFDGPLDMRMNPTQGESAADLVNHATPAELTKILYQYGEERFTPRIVRAIINQRAAHPITTTQQLVEIIKSTVPAKALHGQHPAMRTFMALRIAVNDELAPLQNALTDIIALLNPGGRLAVITFHSLEDRIVKQLFRTMARPCTCPRDIPYCACGKVPQLREITRRPILPSQDELTANNRAHSAKLRIAEKI
ncbi:MAG: 16S rRNA (cytosine(1402)-N(4))-methyltransferase RsmH [Defluviitaleaceae bacterium]|nr:16S rRNA (cytosine(1402)-N(4))-methyltransferase RsmH [Defluviitaleaceae bacterium]